MDADVVVVGAGLAGLVAAVELADAGLQVAIVDQEGPQSIGGQAFWSFGGLFLVDSPEQRRMGVRDSLDLAWSDWDATAGFDRAEDHWPRAWARAFVEFAAGDFRAWLRYLGIKLFPVVGWAERGGGLAAGPGNSVPRFHITWGTGPGVVDPFAQRAAGHPNIRFHWRHRVDALTLAAGAVTGVEGVRLAPDEAERGVSTSREAVGGFALSAQAVLVASGGIGGNIELVRRHWPRRLGQPPASMLCGVPAHVDGRMLDIGADAGARIVNADRMWHYTEGVRNFAPIWPAHGIRIIPGPSSIWLDAAGNRLPAPNFPGFDTLGTLQYLRRTGRDHSWFITTQTILKKEFALSGSEQNPDLTERDWKAVLARIRGRAATPPVEAFKEQGEDWVVAEDLDRLIARMNGIAGEDVLDAAHVRRQIEARDSQIANGFGKDAQIAALRGARKYMGDRLIRTARPHRILDPAHGPLIAVRLHVLTRKSLGGIETDLGARCLAAPDRVMPGLYAAGEVAGFGGGGMHGYRALEGTFLGGCMFSGRQAARGIAEDLGP
ncbi:hypothetical protein SAMN05421538_101630 [Paracoccus isoporae]|uniref:FAD-dependent oxidoreductase 2 FAD-binding domain-containing protein n=1 Tax=Paracoccus isoporae TaxID=591205 RepID=A0A1G6UW62_9RHOB|nr:FAD-binding dehydrogenase [Paracoccus isoporae]SDD44835.1 hypothetical protein SAMN05421538_101630 [Paracoccus isoporae]